MIGDIIIATIFHIASTFSAHYPNTNIFIKGRNEATTRLYRGAVNHGYKELSKEFSIYGGTYSLNNEQYSFEAFNGERRYDAFLFKRR
jgi:outer membrane protease